MSGQNILTGSKLCWEATFRQGTICPDAISRPDEIFSMDESGVTDKAQQFLKAKSTDSIYIPEHDSCSYTTLRRPVGRSVVRLVRWYCV